MSDRPYVILSCAMSIDGYIDDASPDRLLLSSDADLDRVDELRASCDAVMVGAATVRADDPRLLVRAPDRRAARVARGMTATPAKVTITGGGDLKPTTRFFTDGDTAKIVYAATPVFAPTQDRLGAAADVVDAGDPVDLSLVLADLATRNVQRLLVEGGSTVHTQLLSAGLADELWLAIAPFFVGDSRAPRFVHDGAFPLRRTHPARLVSTASIGDLVVLRYALSDRFAE